MPRKVAAKTVKKTVRKKSNEMPKEVKVFWHSEYGAEKNLDIADKFKLDIGQLSILTGLVGKIYKKEVALEKIEDILVKELKIKKDLAVELAVEVFGQRLLVVDKEWFEGKISVRLDQLGSSAEKFNEQTEKYQEAVELEVAADEAEAKKEALDLVDTGEYVKEKIKEVPKKMQTPAEEKKSARNVFSKYIKGILEDGDVALKVELNIRILTLLLSDEEGESFQKELVNTLYDNKELLTEKEIKTKNETVDPTIGNWLKDYVSFVGAENLVSSIKKAKYYTESKNVTSLSKEEKELVDKLLDLFVAVKNVYINANRVELEDIYLFPFSHEEQKQFIDEMEAEVRKAQDQQEKVKAVDAETSSEEIDLVSLYQYLPQDRMAINKEKENLVKRTRKEYDKIADIFANYLLKRNKYGILAAIELLAETGALDTLLAKDKRYNHFITGYLSRNNLQGLEEEFKSNPYQAKFVQYFLKFVLLERLGMKSTDGAKIAAVVGNIFQENEVMEYGQIAYLDLQDNKFKWSEL